MRLGILILLLIATLFGSVFWYGYITMACRVPIHYRIGTIDSRFDTDPSEIQRILRAAEAVWEKPLSAELFIYDEEGDLPINFVFDERQEQSNDEADLREDLEVKGGLSEEVAQQYEALIAEFNTLRVQYESRADEYESELRAYNREVTDWNEEGGAPEDERQKLAARADALTKEQGELEAFAKRLNTIIEELNRIGARGNSLIADYNTIVEEYNDRFAETREFAQGDYTGKAINIYEFDSEEELTIVLAHEFGHALSLGHVEGDDSIMYHHMGAQELDRGITAGDRAEYGRICTDRGIIATAIRYIGERIR